MNKQVEQGPFQDSNECSVLSSVLSLFFFYEFFLSYKEFFPYKKIPAIVLFSL